MRMRAALVPPAPVLKELADVVRAVGGHPDELEPVPVAALHLPLASFGNVTQGDAVVLENALAQVASSIEPFRLRFAGAAALEWPGDDSVWAKLEGDLDSLLELGRAVPASVQRLGFVLDRRTFRGWVRVGRITDRTSAPYLEQLFARLEDYRSASWTTEDLVLLRERYASTGGPVQYESYSRLSLSRGRGAERTGR